jgi:hypothetical protein
VKKSNGIHPSTFFVTVFTAMTSGPLFFQAFEGFFCFWVPESGRFREICDQSIFVF